MIDIDAVERTWRSDKRFAPEVTIAFDELLTIARAVKAYGVARRDGTRVTRGIALELVRAMADRLAGQP